jgi:hypothetical protein
MQSDTGRDPPSNQFVTLIRVLPLYVVTVVFVSPADAPEVLDVHPSPSMIVWDRPSRMFLNPLAGMAGAGEPTAPVDVAGQQNNDLSV